MFQMIIFVPLPYEIIPIATVMTIVVGYCTNVQDPTSN